MAATLENIVGRWLRRMTISVSPHFLREKLQSHPDYPSLRSISDVLDELQVDNAALQIDKERLQEAPLPFLAHHTAKGEFVIIDNISKQVKPGSDFEKNWNGAALLAEKPENWRHAENEKRLTDEKKSVQTLSLAALSVLALAGFSLLNGFNGQLAGLLAASVAGLFVSILIVQQELGISNELTEKLCHTGKNIDCGAVMYSKGSKIGRWLNPIAIGWADVGIIYFTAYTLLLVSFLYNNVYAGITVLAILSAAAMPFTFFSLYYQWRVVKKWCTLCLLTVAVLWLQFALLSGVALIPIAIGMSNGELWQSISINYLLFAAFLFTTISALWLLLVKPVLLKNRQLLTEKFSLLRFKNNPIIFETLLQQQRRVDTTPFENDLQLGNPDAAVQILVACNPYCGPCAQAHKQLHELVRGTDIGLTVRFSVKADNKDDKRTQATEYLLQLVTDSDTFYKRNVLHDWYAEMNSEKFIAKYSLEELSDVQQQLEQNEQWSTDAKIAFTPTIFINGYELPKQYKAADLGSIIRQLATELTTETEPTKNNYAPA